MTMTQNVFLLDISFFTRMSFSEPFHLVNHVQLNDRIVHAIQNLKYETLYKVLYNCIYIPQLSLTIHCITQ